MHLNGRDIVSPATQRSARQLAATALAVFLTKFYGQPLTGLNVFGVEIQPDIVFGAAFIVVAFQMATFAFHWLGDLAALEPWNSAERVPGLSRIGAASRVVDRIGQVEEQLEKTEKAARALQGQADQAAIDRVASEVRTAREALEALQRSAVRLGRYGAFYLYGLYGALPASLGVAALFWPTVQTY